MADMPFQGPQTSGQPRPTTHEHGQSQDLTDLSVAPHFSESDTPSPSVHTSATVTTRWASRDFGTGVVMTGRVIRQVAV